MVRVIYSILLFIFLFVIVTFWAETKEYNGLLLRHWIWRSKLVGSISHVAPWRRQKDVKHRDVNVTSRQNTCMPYGKPDWKRKWNLFWEFSMCK